MLKPTIFREYDIRGVADSELTTPGIELLGRGLGTYFIRHSGKAIGVGRDCRLSSPRLRDALVKGLRATGCDVTDIGVVPTPVLYFSAQRLKADGAVMITGSHNPPDYNGFKSVCGEGTIHSEAIQQVRRIHRESGCRRRQRHRRPGDAPHSEKPERRCHRDVLRDGRPLPQPPSRPDRARESRALIERCANRTPISASPSTATPTASARWTRTGTVIYGDQLMIIYGREILSASPAPPSSAK
jgi:hypothetical protein